MKLTMAGSLVAVCLTTLSAGAAPFGFYEDGDAFGFSAWTSLEREGGGGGATVTPQIGVALDGHSTAIVLDPGAVEASEFLSDVIYTPGLGGNMTSYAPSGASISGMRFDFYAGANGSVAGTGAPNDLGFYFQTTVGHVWFYDIDTLAIGNGWNTYEASFDFNAGLGWYGFDDIDRSGASYGDGDEATFLADLALVDNLGIWITYADDKPTGIYGIDNFGLTVPEPQTYVVLGVALLTVAFVFRKRITDSLANTQAMLQS